MGQYNVRKRNFSRLFPTVIKEKHPEKKLFSHILESITYRLETKGLAIQ